MEKWKESCRNEQDRHLHSTRFKVYMMAWSVFFLFIFSLKFAEVIRHFAAHVASERVELASSAFSYLRSIPSGD